MARLPYIIPYDPSFLGNGFVVPLPAASSTAAGTALQARLLNGGQQFDYLHYSLVMHAARKQALFTGCNLDGDLQKQVSRTDWDLDSRLLDYQIGNEAYRDQPGRPNPWDRGHLVRRQDVCWGTRQRAKDASDSTFFYTNSSLQHHNFNGDEWNQLEDWVLEKVTEASSKLCVFTGQFLTERDPFLEVNPGIRVQIPAGFWKVIVLLDPTSNGSDLSAAAFVIPQSEDFIRTVSGQNTPPWTSAQIRTYQVNITDLEALTGLTFGELRNVDDFPWSAVRFRTDHMWEAWQPITDPGDIALGGDRRRSAGMRALRVLSNQDDDRIATPRQTVGPRKSAVDEGAPIPGAPAGESCGCGSPNKLETAVVLLERKIDQLATTLLTYANTKLEEVEEMENTKPAAIDGTGTRAAASLLTYTAKLNDNDRQRARTLIRDVSRIRGGIPTVAGDFPSCALLGDESDYYCTGVLISSRVVLTAAHCGRGVSRVLLGVRDQGEVGSAPAQRLDVAHLIRHPQYSQNLLPWHDITLLVLAAPVVETHTVKPIGVLPQSELPHLGDVTIVGFGNTNAAGTEGFGRKRQATVRILNTFDTTGMSAADIRAEEVRRGFDAPDEFFAGADNLGIDTCRGDSGGPVYASVNGQWYLVGLTSRGSNIGDEVCGDGGIYTSVNSYLSWIESVRARYSV